MEHCIIDNLLAEIGSVQSELEEVIITHGGHGLHTDVISAYQSIKEQLIELTARMEKANPAKMQYKYAKHVLDALVLRYKVYAPTDMATI